MTVALREFGTARRCEPTVQLHVGRFVVFGALSNLVTLAAKMVLPAPVEHPTVVAIYGPRHTGRTALACKIAAEAAIPHVRYVSQETLLGLNTSAAVGLLDETYHACLMAGKAVLILDEIASVPDWSTHSKLRYILTRPFAVESTLAIIYVGADGGFPTTFIVQTSSLTEDDADDLNRALGLGVQWREGMSIGRYMAERRAGGLTLRPL